MEATTLLVSLCHSEVLAYSTMTKVFSHVFSEYPCLIQLTSAYSAQARPVLRPPVSY
jgi:hypothetical protein